MRHLRITMVQFHDVSIVQNQKSDEGPGVNVSGANRLPTREVACRLGSSIIIIASSNQKRGRISQSLLVGVPWPTEERCLDIK